MSWTQSYPPRSRSRSPGRAPYPQYGDQYRDQWEPYDRERAWFERDRAPYDYRRGRSRSPPSELSRKRPRSGSPYDRDRYEPRPRYNDDYDGPRYGYASPPRRGPSSYPSRRAPPDPHQFDYPASLKQYAEWFRYFYPQQAADEDNADKAAEHEAGDGSKPRNGIKSRWEKYKKDFATNQLQTMFEHHRKSPWFSEKYDPAPEFQNLRKRVRKEGWEGRLSTFLLDLEAGKFDPELNEAEPESPQKENGAANGEGTAESASASAHANGTAAPISEDVKPVVDDDEMQFNMNVEEDPADADAGRADANGKGGNKGRVERGDEVSVMSEGNQVMIRTIPPDIGRVKLEDACSKISGFVYLALGDPLQKRNFYRAGWLRFQDDADMGAVLTELSEKKIEGFKLHVTHNIKPFTNRIRYAPEVASRPDRLEKDLANAKALAGKLEGEWAELRAFKAEEKVKSDGEDVKMEGADADADGGASTAAGSEAVDARIEKVMREQTLVDASDEKAYDNLKTTVSLDLYLAYMRAAFHTCYYCAVVTDHVEELQRKCIRHERKPMSKIQVEELKAEAAAAAAVAAEGQVKDEVKEEEKDKALGEGEEEKGKEKEKEKDKEKEKGKEKDWRRTDERWLEWLDSKVAVLINRDGVDPRDYGGKAYEEELTKAVEPYVKQEDEGKFRCKTCQKLFKATSFVEKHIANKHPEHVKALEEIPFYNNFALDPHRIQPFLHAPPNTGNGQAPPPQAYGVQGHGGDYGGGRQYGGSYPQGRDYPQWDHGHSRRDEQQNGRRLSDRLGGFADAAGLPAKPPTGMDGALVSGNSGPQRRNSGRSGMQGPPPPPPPDAREDPRAAAGRKVSYHDMDLVAEGDIELSY